MKAINWNNSDNQIAKIYWKQNINQFWTEEAFKVSRDLPDWGRMTEAERRTYVEVLSGLTGLDREQGDNGMPLISIHHDNMHEQAVFAWMGMMEHIHAKSYSHIFSTLIPSKKTNYYLGEWVDRQPELQAKYQAIAFWYNQLYDRRENVTPFKRYMAMTASVFLESFSFYSGFFYPVYLSGQGRMIASGEIIRKIIQDESIHGSFTGMVAQRLYQEDLSDSERVKADHESFKLLDHLLDIEKRYTQKIYADVGLVKEVNDYVLYNANRALQNLGRDDKYEHDPVSQIVLNGIDTGTINHDFFSTKGDYVVPLNIEPLTDDDFKFDNV
ncbi:class 1b ribonucleoside-diphosphate reductase subunit beta [Sporolactobacillus sp. Y61]|jgi:ribonucleoside-diphosphate reductase beta chain|uniref:ribonucleoside-diphosphate reductase n=1 Tax=Sporolactobacillus sp. Y61 TaxID=3160863 RepID=A0AAU8IC23_9BACL|nr:class 1b ribonucleoside-diphosphate reductase subunit beta [Sporolactobacillus sp. THM19-2]RYL93552.1 class 1b ribonucleoside-diphosphate reductase subunit beta [Sporolactobacillus sp. THM19-2]